MNGSRNVSKADVADGGYLVSRISGYSLLSRPKRQSSGRETCEAVLRDKLGVP